LFDELATVANGQGPFVWRVRFPSHLPNPTVPLVTQKRPLVRFGLFPHSTAAERRGAFAFHRRRHIDIGVAAPNKPAADTLEAAGIELLGHGPP
jgi:hypothetical protein